MKKNCLFSFALIITFLLTFPITSYACSATKEVGELKTVISIGIGAGLDQLTYTQKGLEVANDGPASFAIYKNETYILDTLAKRILVYENNNYVKTLQIPYTIYPRDILVKKDNIYLLDTEIGYVFLVDKNGILTKEYPLPSNVPNYKITNFVNNPPQNVLIEADSHYYDITNGEESTGWKNIDNHILKINRTKTSAKLTSNGKEINSIDFKDAQGGAKIESIDNNGNIIINVTDISSIPNAEIFSELTYHKLDKFGKEIGVIRIPVETYSNFPLNFIKTDEKGQAYVMALMEDKVEIEKVIFGKKYDSKLGTKKKLNNNVAPSTKNLAVEE